MTRKDKVGSNSFFCCVYLHEYFFTSALVSMMMGYMMINDYYCKETAQFRVLRIFRQGRQQNGLNGGEANDKMKKN